jgi:hypothetical protein
MYVKYIWITMDMYAVNKYKKDISVLNHLRRRSNGK